MWADGLSMIQFSGLMVFGLAFIHLIEDIHNRFK